MLRALLSCVTISIRVTASSFTEEECEKQYIWTRIARHVDQCLSALNARLGASVIVRLECNGGIAFNYVCSIFPPYPVQEEPEVIGEGTEVEDMKTLLRESSFQVRGDRLESEQGRDERERRRRKRKARKKETERQVEIKRERRDRVLGFPKGMEEEFQSLGND